MKKTYGIIGSSAAGIGALIKLRQLDTESHIICISSQAHLPYNKCFLADYVSRSLEYDDLFLLTPERIKELDIDLRLYTMALSINTAARTVTTAQGEIHYDGLLLAMGSSPLIPQIPGLSGAGIFSFHSLSDIENIIEYSDIHSIDTIAIIGAGITGLECADALSNRGKKIILIERAASLLPLLGPCDLHEVIAMHIAHSGIQLLIESQVECIERGQGLPSAVRLVGGKRIPAQLVISAIGVKSVTQLPQESGLLVGPYGLIVDDFFKTSDPHIYAAGDMIQVKDQLSGEYVHSRLWPDAMNQGMRAALAMVGQQSKSYPGIIQIVKTHFFGIDLLSFGWNPVFTGHQETIQRDQYTAFIQVQDNCIQGICLVGKGFDIALARRAVLTRMTINDYRAGNA
jgi:NAD(P)H-nitrite reductase large subunit